MSPPDSPMFRKFQSHPRATHGPPGLAGLVSTGPPKAVPRSPTPPRQPPAPPTSPACAPKLECCCKTGPCPKEPALHPCQRCSCDCDGMSPQEKLSRKRGRPEISSSEKRRVVCDSKSGPERFSKSTANQKISSSVKKENVVKHGHATKICKYLGLPSRTPHKFPPVPMRLTAI